MKYILVLAIFLLSGCQTNRSGQYITKPSTRLHCVSGWSYMPFNQGAILLLDHSGKPIRCSMKEN